jgi:hypothetical protein
MSASNSKVLLEYISPDLEILQPQEMSPGAWMAVSTLGTPAQHVSYPPGIVCV